MHYVSNGYLKMYNILSLFLKITLIIWGGYTYNKHVCEYKIFYYYCNKLTQIQWLKSTQIHYLTVFRLEVSLS